MITLRRYSSEPSRLAEERLVLPAICFVGGVSVLRHIRMALPVEDLIYCADSKFAPYGNKSPEFIREQALVSSKAFEGWMEAGAAQAFAFEAGRLPGGTYFVRAVGETFTAVRTVTLVK